MLVCPPGTEPIASLRKLKAVGKDSADNEVELKPAGDGFCCSPFLCGCFPAKSQAVDAVKGTENTLLVKDSPNTRPVL